MASQIQSSTFPPAQPSYILRGHTSQIHAVRFFRQNLRLLTGDADGWVVCWSLPIKRPVAVWRPHSATVLGIGGWGHGRVVTHGRDGRLHIWQLREGDETGMSRTLPIDDAVSERKQPWLLHTLVVNAINFCSFSSLDTPAAVCDGRESGDHVLLIATPGVQDGSINITSFPAEERTATIPPPRDTNTGMLMATGLCRSLETDEEKSLVVLGGYESGHTAVFQQNAAGLWECRYLHKAHSQPVLSLAVLPPAKSGHVAGAFLSSSADAVIARHPLPSSGELEPNSSGASTLQTKHVGQQSLNIRSDRLIFATAGWDGRIRVYSTKTIKELAVLKWHKEGCYAVDFARVETDGQDPHGQDGKKVEVAGEMARGGLTVAEQRVERAKTTHWIAAGSKDGKISLWDVY